MFEQIGTDFVAAAEMLFACQGHVLVAGSGTSHAVGARLAHLLSCCGTPALFIHPGDSQHGLSGAVTERDVLIALSKGGETTEVNFLAGIAKQRGAKVIALTEKPDSTLGRQSDLILCVTAPPEADPYGMIATGSSLVNCAARRCPVRGTAPHARLHARPVRRDPSRRCCRQACCRGSEGVMRLIGLDIGTTGCKTIVFDADGNLLGSASREYTVDIPQPDLGRARRGAGVATAQDALRQAIATAGPGDRIAAVGLSVQGEAVMPVDARGQALRPAILGMDTRTGEQNAWLAATFGAEYLFERTGMPIHTVNTLPKLLWLKQHEPEIWHTRQRFLLYEDFIINKMTGRPAISRCLASRTQAYDLPDDRWSPDILADHRTGCRSVWRRCSRPAWSPARCVPRWRRPWTGRAAAGGDRRPRPGVRCAGRRSHPTRTWPRSPPAPQRWSKLAMDSPALNAMLRRGNISVYAHVVPGLYLAMALNQSGGLVLRWYRDTFCQAEIQQAQAARTECLRPYPCRRLTRAVAADRAASPVRQRHTLVRHGLQGRHPGPDLRNDTPRCGQGHPGGTDLRTASQPGPAERGWRGHQRAAGHRRRRPFRPVAAAQGRHPRHPRRGAGRD